MAEEYTETPLPIVNHIREVKHTIEKRLNDDYQFKTDINLLNFKEQLNIDDNYSINESEFKKILLPRLLNMAAITPDSKGQQASALLLLQIILFNDWKVGRSQLTKIALKASLIPKLISINGTTNETEIQELVSGFYLLLCFVVANDNKNVKKLLLSADNLLIDWTIRTLQNSNNENQIKDLLILLQFYIYNAKDYKTISPVLSSITSFLKHTDQTVISQSLYTLLVFCQSFRESRIAIIETKIGQKLFDLWVENESEEQIIKPTFAIFKSLLSRFNHYKNQFLSKELNILEIIPKLIGSSTELNRIYANQIIKILAMKPINAKHYSSIEQINAIIKYKSMEEVNKLLQFDDSVAVKFSALNTSFALAFNSSLDQLKLLAHGCLQALCSQLETENKDHLKVVVYSISIFLMEEFKDNLKTKYIFVKPNDSLIESLTPFAAIIRECDGFNKLCQLNRERIQKENQFNKGIPEWRHKKEGYQLSDTEKMIEEILALSFGVETRPKRRQPEMEVMEVKSWVLPISCCDCQQKTATTNIFKCGHLSYCQKCASSAVHKIYSQESKKCGVEKCGKPIAVMDCPFYLFKSKLYKEYVTQQAKLEMEIAPEVHK